MYLPHRDRLFQKKRHRASPYVIALLIALIMILLIILRDQQEGRITPMFMAISASSFFQQRIFLSFSFSPLNLCLSVSLQKFKKIS